MSKAIVDLSTGKIIGCKKNSLVWFHEKGHIVYNKSDQGIRNSYRQNMFFMNAISMGIFSLFFKFFRLFALVCLLTYFGYIIYEESWCWKYARERFKNKKD